MEIDISKLEEVCGSKPSNMEFILVGNDPNFVYQIDPSYQVKILYDAESNIINVNSWLECDVTRNNCLYNTQSSFTLTYVCNVSASRLSVGIGRFKFVAKSLVKGSYWSNYFCK